MIHASYCSYAYYIYVYKILFHIITILSYERNMHTTRVRTSVLPVQYELKIHHVCGPG